MTSIFYCQNTNIIYVQKFRSNLFRTGSLNSNIPWTLNWTQGPVQVIDWTLDWTMVRFSKSPVQTLVQNLTTASLLPMSCPWNHTRFQDWSLFPIIHCMALKEPAEEYLCSLFEDTCKACYCSTERSSTGSQTMGRVIIVIIDLVSCHCCTGVFYFVSLAIPRPTRRPLCNPGPGSANNHTNH